MHFEFLLNFRNGPKCFVLASGRFGNGTFLKRRNAPHGAFLCFLGQYHSQTPISFPQSFSIRKQNPNAHSILKSKNKSKGLILPTKIWEIFFNTNNHLSNLFLPIYAHLFISSYLNCGQYNKPFIRNAILSMHELEKHKKQKQSTSMQK